MHMKNTYVLTTNLAAPIYMWLNERTKAKSVTKRDTIETALEKLRIEEKKQAMAASFREAMKDTAYMKEMIFLADAGIDEWGRDLDKIDGGYLSKRNISRKPQSNRGKRAGR